MKRKIYIILSVILFVLLGALTISVIEFLLIKLVISDFDRYGLGLSWDDIVLIRNSFAILVLLGFSFLGYFVGQKWWKYVYIDKKYKIK